MPAHASHLLQPLDVGCFGPLRKAYGRETERLIGCSINQSTKIEFFPAFHAAHRAAITESNIKGGFRGAGLAPFNPENVISKLDVQLRTPTPPAEGTVPSTPWTARTPKTLLEAQSHSNIYREGSEIIRVAPQSQLLKLLSILRRQQASLSIRWSY
jgi:hypothetical protein